MGVLQVCEEGYSLVLCLFGTTVIPTVIVSCNIWSI